MKQSPQARAAWARKEQVTSEIVKRTLGGEGVNTLKLIGEIYMMAYDEGAHAVLREVMQLTGKYLEEVDNASPAAH